MKRAFVRHRFNRAILFYFNFDKFLPTIDAEDITSKATKLFRKAAVLAVDSLFGPTLMNIVADRNPVDGLLEYTIQELDRNANHTTQDEIIITASQILSTVTITDIDGREQGTEGQTVILFLLDDNNIYRSMRYEYYQLARKHAVSFLQFFFQVPLTMAKARDASRDTAERVGDDVIVKMAAKLEEPDLEAYRWERRSCKVVIEKCDENRGSDKQSNDLPLGREGISNATNNCDILEYHVTDMEQIVDRICVSARDEIVQPIVVSDLVSAEQRELDRQASLNNVLHQSDVKLRGLVSLRMQELAREGHNKETIKSEAARLSKLKASIYERVKAGEIELDLDGLHSELEMIFCDAC